ncbi:MAG TPA: tripartite tricarboxylate transporter substrate-binding protein [Pseudolabrys sp.]|nr:tripartite tricarboxylate transporter substrate-binding protein [Pseudolabrys sp.]
MKVFLRIAVVIASFIAAAQAADYPSRPIVMVVPLSVGGSTDVIGRLIAEGMRKTLKQPIVVENTSGAGGTIGVARVVHAPPDGYTMLIGQWGTNVATGAIYNLNFDLLKDLEPIGLIATQPFLIVGKKSLPANNLRELIDWIKANPQTATEGNSGVGSPSHVAGVLFQKAIGSPIQMIPYRGAGESTQAIVSGQIDVLLNTPAVSMEQLKAGQVKVYAVTAKRRIPTAPDIPTTDEAGLPGYYFSFWHALWVPKGTPGEAKLALNTALRNALADPQVRERLTQLSQDIFPPEEQSPEALATFQRQEIEKWWPIVRAAGIKPQ